jgi:hypothetical protein
LVNQELREIPLDVITQNILFLRAQIFEKRVCVWTIYFDFGKDRKGDSIVQLAELLNFGIIAWFLVAELVAGKGQDFQAFFVP